jgi:hypothetical protein
LLRERIIPTPNQSVHRLMRIENATQRRFPTATPNHIEGKACLREKLCVASGDPLRLGLRPHHSGGDNPIDL